MRAQKVIDIIAAIAVIIISLWVIFIERGVSSSFLFALLGIVSGVVILFGKQKWKGGAIIALLYLGYPRFFFRALGAGSSSSSDKLIVMATLAVIILFIISALIKRFSNKPI